MRCCDRRVRTNVQDLFLDFIGVCTYILQCFLQYQSVHALARQTMDLPLDTHR